MSAEDPRCARCEGKVIRELDGKTMSLVKTCCLIGGGTNEMILPRAGKPGATAADVIAALVSTYPREDNSGTCRYCGTDMYEDGETADTHRSDCPWVMANTVAGLEGAME